MNVKLDKVDNASRWHKICWLAGTKYMTKNILMINCGRLLVMLMPILAGCAAAVSGAAGQVADAAKVLVGLPPSIELPARSRSQTIRLYVSPSANINDAGKGLAVVARFYKLREAGGFEQAPREMFDDTAKLTAAIGQEVVEQREQVLIPGQRYELKERFPGEAKYFGLAVLFRHPGAPRWRIVLPMDQIDADEPLTIGVQACAVTVSMGLKDKAMQDALARVGTGSCRQEPKQAVETKTQ